MLHSGKQESGLSLEEIEKLSDKELISLFEIPRAPVGEPVLGLFEEYKQLEKRLGKTGETRHTYWLAAIIRKELKIERSNYEILQILGISLLDKTPVNELLTLTNYKNVKEQFSNQLTLSLF